MKIFEEIGKQYISSAVKKSKYGWPPVCIGLVFQPERPAADTSTKCQELKSFSTTEQIKE